MNTTTVEKELLCVKDIMKRLGVGRNVATEIMHDLKPKQIGKRFYIPSQVLEKWIKTFSTE
jgi:hypothetical protein